MIAAGAGGFCKLRETDEHQIELGSCVKQRARERESTC